MPLGWGGLCFGLGRVLQLALMRGEVLVMRGLYPKQNYMPHLRKA